MNNIPKKILEIEDLVYILPDDFRGSVSEALLHMLKYIEASIRDKEKASTDTAADNDPSIFKLLDTEFKSRASMKYVMHTYNEETNEYITTKVIDT